MAGLENCTPGQLHMRESKRNEVRERAIDFSVYSVIHFDEWDLRLSTYLREKIIHSNVPSDSER